MLCLSNKAKQQSALDSLASSPYMVVSNSQVEIGSKIPSEGAHSIKCQFRSKQTDLG